MNEYSNTLFYNNLFYQYNNIMIGAFSDEAGFALLTPKLMDRR